MASVSKPSVATGARAKKPVTYGKQSRKIHPDVTFDESVKGQSPRTGLSKLSKVSTSPNAVSVAILSGANPGNSADFDISSSEDESPARQHVSKPKLALKRKTNTTQAKFDIPRHRVIHSGNNSKSGNSLTNETHTATPFPGGVATLVSEVRSHRARETPPNASTFHKKRKHTSESSVQEQPESRHAKATLNQSTPTQVQSKRRKDTEKPSGESPFVRQKSIAPTASALTSVNMWDVPGSNSDTNGTGTGDTLVDCKTVRTRDQSNVGPGTGPVKAPSKSQNAQGGRRTAKSPMPRLPPYYQQNEVGEEAQGPATPTRASPRFEVSEPHVLQNTPPTQVERHSTPSPQPRGINTPRQARLWRDLLNGDVTSATPSRDIDLFSLDHKDRLMNVENLVIETPRRKRLIDALMPSAQSSSDDLQESDELSGSEETDQNSEVLDGDPNPDDYNTAISLPHHLTENVSFESVQQSRIAAGGPKFTYGGHRTYLAASNDMLEDMLAQPFDLDTGSAIGTARSDQPGALRKGAALELLLGMDDDDDGTRAVRTIHDLRAGGDSERFADEVSEIVDGLDSIKSTVSRKRGAVLELCQKLGDPMFRTRFVNSGYDFQVFQLCSSESDAIIGAAAAAAVILILGSEGSLCNPGNVHEAGIFSTLSEMLDFTQDLKSIAKDRRSNMSRVGRASVEKFTDQLVRLPMRKNSNPQYMSPMKLALGALDLSIRKLRESGNTDALLEHGIISKLLDILKATLQRLKNDKSEDLDKSMLDQLETILSILESCTTVSKCALDSSLWDEKTLERLVDSLDTAMTITMPRERSTQRLIPRLSLNLANNSERASRKFANGSYIQRLTSRIRTEFDLLLDATDDSMDLDILLLSLGAMLNLAECSDEIRRTVIKHGRDVVDALIEVFLRGRRQAGEADSLAASQANVAYGWLAVLLGNLCQNETIREQVRKRLPGRGLSALVEAVDEFIVHHKEADKSAQSNEAYVTFTKRLQSVAEMMRSL